MNHFSVSVIIPTYKDWPRLKLCLDALSKQTYPKDQFEVIVVNNDPEDTSPFDLPSANMKIIEEAKPGSYAARNAGIRIAQGEILGFTDSDCIPANDWIEQAVTLFTKNPDIDRIAGAVNVFPLKENPVYINKYESMYAIRQDKYAAQGKAATANLFAKATLFKKCGLFIDTVYSGEDHAWNLRVRKKGFTMVFGQKCVVLHPARTKSQIFVKTKRLLTTDLKKTGVSESFSKMLFWGVIHLRPPVNLGREIFTLRHRYKIGFREYLNILLFVYKIRFVRFKEHYNLLFGAKPERR